MSQGRQQWTKPNDIMRTRSQQKRRSSGVGARRQSDKSLNKNEGSPSNTDVLQPEGSSSRKRKNPFGVSSSSTRRKSNGSDGKKPTATVTGGGDASVNDSAEVTETKGHRLFSALNYRGKPGKPGTEKETGGNSTNEATSPLAATPVLGGGDGDGAINTSSTPQAQDSEAEDSDQSDEGLPLDWSLKGKVRVVFYTDLLPPALLAPDRHAALTRFMLMEPAPDRKARALSRFVHSQPLNDSDSEGHGQSMLFSLRQACHYWVYPALPGFPEFPRIRAQSLTRDQAWPDAGDRPELQKALHKKWKESFGSVYQQLKTEDCPYFYLCCHNFTALFYVNTQGRRTLSACLTPTTRGLRQALSRDGVEFTMPYQAEDSTQDTSSELKKKGRHSPGHQAAGGGEDGGDDDDDEEDSDDLDILSTDEGASRWLQDVGLDKKCFPTLQPSKVKIQREGYQQVDGRPESLVLCDSSAVQALYNFLINSRCCTAMTGPQAGIPPTVLSPTPFLGATLKSNQIQHSLAQVSSGAVTESRHVMEISGPLLPHHMLNVTAILQQAKDVSALLSIHTHEPTVPFNLPSPPSAGQGDAMPSPLPTQSSGGAVHKDTASSPSRHTTRGRKKAVAEDKPHIETEVVKGTTPKRGSTSSVQSVPDLSSPSVKPSAPSSTPDRGEGCEGILYPGLHSTVHQWLTTPTTLEAATALREIHCQTGRLMWSS